MAAGPESRSPSDRLAYTTSDTLERHYFTGWVGDDGSAATQCEDQQGGQWRGSTAARGRLRAMLGISISIECGGHLVGSRVDVSDPAGDVKLAGAMPYFHAAKWVDTHWSHDSLELQIGEAEEARVLVTSGGHLHYAHQYGQYRERGLALLLRRRGGHCTSSSPFRTSHGAATSEPCRRRGHVAACPADRARRGRRPPQTERLRRSTTEPLARPSSSTGGSAV